MLAVRLIGCVLAPIGVKLARPTHFTAIVVAFTPVKARIVAFAFYLMRGRRVPRPCPKFFTTKMLGRRSLALVANVSVFAHARCIVLRLSVATTGSSVRVLARGARVSRLTRARSARRIDGTHAVTIVRVGILAICVFPRPRAHACALAGFGKRLSLREYTAVLARVVLSDG